MIILLIFKPCGLWVIRFLYESKHYISSKESALAPQKKGIAIMHPF